MLIREITDKAQWENFVREHKPNTFLHSWNWGEFNSAMNNKIFRLGIYDPSLPSTGTGQEPQMVGAALVVFIKAKRGKFLFCPHGPIIKKSQTPKILNSLFVYLKDLAIREKADFIRISPLIENTAENLEIFSGAGFRNSPVHMMHPELSWMLDISKSEEDILKGMRKTTRNLVRRAERDGVKVTESGNKADIDRFYEIHTQTVSRHGFTPFSKKYLLQEFDALSTDREISVFFANYGDKDLSSAIITFYGQTAFYHHGASLASKIPVSYALIWEAIRAAKKRGCKVFNFWGIVPEEKRDHPWAGLTLFKMGFGGYKEEYLHAQDLPITGKYWLNYIVEAVRKIKKGY